MVVLLAIVCGVILGYMLERGDFCFHSALRGIVRVPQELTLLRAYLLVLLVSIPLVQGFIALGWIEPWIAPFAWQANIIGGLIFGIGMVVASTCVTGFFYKLGHGMLGMLVALATWAFADIMVYRGPLEPLRQQLRGSVIDVNGQSATVLNIVNPMVGALLIAVVGFGVAIYLWRSPVEHKHPLWNWRLLGLAVGIFMSVAWLLARAGGANYTFGTSGVPTSLYAYVVDDTAVYPWILISLFSIIPGAILAAVIGKTLWVRGESRTRYLELAAGGLLLGTGAAISGGCNLGHSLVGVPLLSLGSITTTLSMLIGVWIAHGTAKAWSGRQLKIDPSDTSQSISSST